MTAATIHYTPVLHTALRDVAAGRIVQSRWYHGGYTWKTGGRMPQNVQDAIDELAAHHLVVLSQRGVPCLERPVDTNADGDTQLAAWERTARTAS